jgi:hypothetical protein
MQSLGHTGTKTYTGSLERQAVPKMEVISGVTEQQDLGAASYAADGETTLVLETNFKRPTLQAWLRTTKTRSRLDAGHAGCEFCVPPRYLACRGAVLA